MWDDVRTLHTAHLPSWAIRWKEEEHGHGDDLEAAVMVNRLYT